MKGLFVSELRRIFGRRVVRLAVVLVLAGWLLSAVTSFLTSSDDPAVARQRAQEALADCRRHYTEFRMQQPDMDVPLENFCDPRAYEQSFDPSYHFANKVPAATIGLTGALAILAFAVGCSVAGAEWGSGYITTALVWEPRRGRLLVAKVLAYAAVAAIAAAALLALYALLHLPVGALRGSVEGTEWDELAGTWWKGGVIAAFAGGVGVATATALRNTAAAVGIGLAYGAIAEPLLRVWKEWITPWTLTWRVADVLGIARQRVVEPTSPTGVPTVVQAEIPPVIEPIAWLTLYVGIIVGIAYLSFRARDIT